MEGAVSMFFASFDDASDQNKRSAVKADRKALDPRERLANERANSAAKTAGETVGGAGGQDQGRSDGGGNLSEESKAEMMRG